MKLKETECSFQQYCFHFQLVQWGKYTVFAITTASEIFIPVIRRCYIRRGKGDKWWELIQYAEWESVKPFAVILAYEE